MYEKMWFNAKVFFILSVELTFILKDFVAMISMFESGENHGMLKI